MHPNFLSHCESWRTRSYNNEEYCDIYDGRIWHEFQYFDGKPFLSLPFNFAFQVNVDWFQPFTHLKHSEGVIYLSVMNLPRSERFRQENTMLVGVIPGPKEPSKTINSLLAPLVDDLILLWEGVSLRHNQTDVLVRDALLCAGCDIPAARKTCGFVGHGAKKGCSKCLLSFPTHSFGEKPDYSNFNRSEWNLRNNEEHRLAATNHKMANTKAQQANIEHSTGVRYSVLLELPYFDAPRMCIVDPMHNLFLGTAKRVLEIWRDTNVLSHQNFQDMQEKIDNFITPRGLGRIPSKIASNFSGFTAEQWKNWTLYLLKDVLPREHYQCWQIFCKACFLLCRRQNLM